MLKRKKFTMERLTVNDLKAGARSRGLRGYSKLRKAQLINRLRLCERLNRKVIDAPIPLDEIPKEKTILKPTKAKRLRGSEKAVERGKKKVEDWGEWLLNSQPTPKVVDEAHESFKRKLNELHSKQSLENKKKREREVRKVEKKAEKRKREAEKRKREAEKRKVEAENRKRVVEKRRKKRESKKRNKKGSLEVDRKENVIDVEEEDQRSKRKERVNDVEKQIKRLKKKQRKAKGKRKRSLQKVIERLRQSRHSFELVECKSALYHFARQYKIEGVEGYGPERFLLAVKSKILTFLRENPDIKILLALHCIMSKTDLKTGEVEYTDAYFYSKTEINFPSTDVEDLYKTMMDKMLESLATYQQRGSNWVFDSIVELTFHTVKYEPLSGSSYIPLPKNLANKKAIINIKNGDQQCFKWCITRALNPVVKDSERITKILRLQAEKLNWKDLKFPMELTQISRFEKLNEVSVNVFGYEKVVYPLRVSTHMYDYSHHVNLLLISEGEKKHYCLIKSMSRLLSSQVSTKKAKKFFCPRCLNFFGRQDLLDKHLELCGNNEAVRIKMLEEGTFVYFKNNHKMMDMPFVIYADFESIMRAIRKIQKMKKKMKKKKTYTKKKQKHIPASFCYYVKCSFDDNLSKVVEFTATSENEDVAKKFVDELEQEVKSIYKDHPPKKMIFTKKDNAKYKKSESCWMCGGGFTDQDCKVRDHCHYTGKFRGAAHNSCNKKYRRPKFTPVIFHNLSGYDAHLFIKNLGVSEGNIDCIPNNEEKYISFTKHVEVDRFTKDEKEVIVTRELRFIDSFKFMSFSVNKLVKNLGEGDFVNMKKYFNGEHLQLLKRKGVYPYEWLDSVERLNETQLPSKDAFYSKLSGKGISEEDYKHAQKVWNTFNMETMRDYHNLYNKTDVLLLADVFENFRKVCKEIYELDPCWYYTAPGLAWDACLKLTNVRLELLTDLDMLLMFEKGVRGGISMISNRHGQANNKYMEEKFDETKPSKFITYLDANNLYGYAMSKKLPIGGFKWMTEKELENWRSFGCILEVALEYPKELHNLHNDYPLAPERLMIDKVQKLIPNLNDKKHYVLHYESLKQYESLGLKITHIHRGIKFEESDWMKQYIDKNTRLRAETKKESEKEFFKLMNNSVYGKTIENLRKRVDISLVNSKKKAKRLTAKPNFKKCTIFSETDERDFCAIEMRKTQIYFNKPVYLGMCILDLSKTLMYDFHYNYIKPKYTSKAKLLFTDTDSLAYEIQTEDFYRDISSDVQAKFDTSNFSENHPSGILVGANKKVVGMFKDEAGGKIIEEFVGLRAKLYSYKMFESEEEKKERKKKEEKKRKEGVDFIEGSSLEKKKCKGMKKGVVKKKITFDD